MPKSAVTKTPIQGDRVFFLRMFFFATESQSCSHWRYAGLVGFTGSGFRGVGGFFFIGRTWFGWPTIQQVYCLAPWRRGANWRFARKT
jgi:hypothetical protein